MDLSNLKNFRVTCDGRGVVTVALDVPGRAYNLFTEQVLAELQSLVAHLEHDPAARLVIFRSAKESGFLAGGDLREISALPNCQSRRTDRDCRPKAVRPPGRPADADGCRHSRALPGGRLGIRPGLPLPDRPR